MKFLSAGVFINAPADDRNAGWRMKLQPGLRITRYPGAAGYGAPSMPAAAALLIVR